MISEYAEDAERRNARVQMHSLLRSMSALLAMEYRRAPLPISPDLVRWFASQTGPETAVELGGVLRHCLLLGDETLVLGELRKIATESGKTPTVLAKGSGNNPASAIDLDGPWSNEEWIANR
jgi:hypothetical protein